MVNQKRMSWQWWLYEKPNASWEGGLGMTMARILVAYVNHGFQKNISFIFRKE